jgi:hypothetical protein
MNQTMSTSIAGLEAAVGVGKEPTFRHLFTNKDLQQIKTALEDPECHRPVQGCLWQMIRLAHHNDKGNKTTWQLQWGLNFGRVQEILKSVVDVEAWWLTFEPHFEEKDWLGVAVKTRLCVTVFGLEQPPDSFISRVVVNNGLEWISGHLFTTSDLQQIKTLLVDPERHHRVEHSMWQLVRLSHPSRAGRSTWRPLWGMNCGRAQEVLESIGSHEAWWLTFKPLITSHDWDGMSDKARLYITIFGLAQPSELILSRP